LLVKVSIINFLIYFVLLWREIPSV
jgi:hypothetical protein